MRTLVDLSPIVWLLLHWFEGLGVWGLLFHLDHIWGGGLGSRREATQCGQSRGTIRVQAFGLQLSLCQEHLPPLHLLLQLVIVRLGEKSQFTHRQHRVLATVSRQGYHTAANRFVVRGSFPYGTQCSVQLSGPM